MGAVKEDPGPVDGFGEIVTHEERAVTERVPLPRTTDVWELNGAFHTALALLGHDLRTRCAPVLTDLYGPDWAAYLTSQYTAGDVNSESDVQMLLREVLRTPTRAGHRPVGATRKVLSSSKTWLDTAERVQKVRNETAHQVGWTLTDAISAAQDLVYLTKEIGLGCAPDCYALLVRLEGLRDGTWVPPCLLYTSPSPRDS